MDLFDFSRVGTGHAQLHRQNTEIFMGWIGTKALIGVFWPSITQHLIRQYVAQLLLRRHHIFERLRCIDNAKKIGRFPFDRDGIA